MGRASGTLGHGGEAPDFECGWWGWSECVWEGPWLWEREPCWRSCFPGSSPGLSIPNAQEMLIAQISPAWHGMAEGAAPALTRVAFFLLYLFLLKCISVLLQI